MANEQELSRELQNVQNVIKTYEAQLKQLNSVFDNSPVEVAKLVSATARGIKRLEKQKTLLNKQLEYAMGKPADGDTNYTYQEGDENR